MLSSMAFSTCRSFPGAMRVASVAGKDDIQLQEYNLFIIEDLKLAHNGPSGLCAQIIHPDRQQTSNCVSGDIFVVRTISAAATHAAARS